MSRSNNEETLKINDIARMSGVSVSTVSRVINNYPYIKKNTKTKVLNVLAKCNYVPNETARNLVKSNTKLIGVLIADIRTTHHTDGIFYVEQEFSRHGYTCLIYNTGYDFEKQASYIQMLSQRKVQAVVLLGSIYQNDEVTAAIQKYLPSTPVAVINGFIHGANIYNIIADEENGVYDAVRLLKSKGKKNPAFMYNFNTPSNKIKISGYKRGVKEFMNCGSTVIKAGDSIEEVENATVKLLNDNPKIDSIIYSEDILAIIGQKAIMKMGKRIPEQIAVIGMNNTKFSALSTPALTTIDNVLYDLTITATKNLLAILNGEHINKKMIICSEIIEREST